MVAAMILSIAPGASAWTSLNAQLQPYLAKYDLPALAAAVVKDGRIVSAGAVGTRRAGVPIPVTINDRFHIGSDTKAMTALLAAMLVEEGKLQWASTVGEVFPELAEGMDPGLRKVTLLQLLSHTGGIASDNEELYKDLVESFTQSGNLDELRYQFIRSCSKYPLAFEPGTGWAYSNVGYVLAGAIIERKTGKTWDEAITERIFRPLKLRTAGLGAQASLGKIDAPLGHLIVDGKVKAFLAGPSGDNPVVIGPAGIAHMSVLDFARWAGWNAGEGKRGPKLVKAETLKKLHTPVADTNLNKPGAPGTPSAGQYALGWGQAQPAWAPSPILTHNGSNNKNLAKISIDLKRDIAVVLMTNIGGTKADQALNDLNEALYRHFAK
jgi:CubicO group peptidase (beta-lactamase class C family)